MSTQIISFAKETKSKKLLFQELPYHAVNIIFYNHGQVLKSLGSNPGAVSWAGRKGATKVFKYGRKSPWVLTFTGPFPNGQANAGS